MKRTLVTACIAVASAALPASASLGVNNNIVYTVTATGANGLAANCTIYADRMTADYGPTTVYAVASSPFGISTTVRCTVTKDGTVWVNTSKTGESLVVISGERRSTIPAAGVTVCAYADSQLSIDAHPTASRCVTG